MTLQFELGHFALLGSVCLIGFLAQLISFQGGDAPTFKRYRDTKRVQSVCWTFSRRPKMTLCLTVRNVQQVRHTGGVCNEEEVQRLDLNKPCCSIIPKM